MAKGYRQFNIMQYEKHPTDGRVLLSEDKIKAVLATRKSIKQWAYIIHDKDILTDEDIQNAHEAYTTLDGDGEKEFSDSDFSKSKESLKPKHFHIVLKFNSAVEISTIASWFDIPDNFIDVAKGANAFLDCVEYLTHEDPKQQALGKYRYGDEEVVSNFDWREELTKYQLRRVKLKGSALNRKEYYRNEVLYHGMTKRQMIEEDADAYREDFQTIDKLRYKYITEFAKVPNERINYYVTGQGGIGKGLLCRALARALYPQFSNDDDVFFIVGAGNALFEGYDGQPVIIWDDKRGYDLLNILGGRDNVFNVFDTHPTKQKQNIKYGSITLINTVNIVNSYEPYKEFLDSLSGEYKDKQGNIRRVEDKSQSYRRFPFIIPIREEDFDVMMNIGVFDGTREYDQYRSYAHLRGNMQRIRESLSGYEEAIINVETQTVTPIIQKHRELENRLKKETENTDMGAILEKFKHYGTQDMELVEIDEKKKKELEMNNEKYIQIKIAEHKEYCKQNGIEFDINDPTIFWAKY